MNAIITEVNYPIQFAWVFKTFVAFFIAIIVTIILFLIGFYNIYLLLLIVYSPIYFVILILRRKNFHYAIEDKFMTLNQGILSKQQRHIPYGVIQNIFVKQDLFDRAFRLASLAIENASQGGKNDNNSNKKFLGMTVSNQKKQYSEAVGFQGNRVSIPGLKKEDAEALKNVVLQKMKENPLEDSHSGL